MKDAREHSGKGGERREKEALNELALPEGVEFKIRGQNEECKIK